MLAPVSYLTHAGYEPGDAEHFGDAIAHGAVVIAVDTDGNHITADEPRSVLQRYGGRFIDNILADNNVM